MEVSLERYQRAAAGQGRSHLGQADSLAGLLLTEPAAPLRERSLGAVLLLESPIEETAVLLGADDTEFLLKN